MMKTTLRILPVGLAVVLMALLPAAAAEVQQKLGTINLSQVFEGYYKTKQANAQLQESAAELDKEGKGLVESYQRLQEEYKTLLESAQDQAVSVEERDKRKTKAESKLLELRGLEQTIAQFQNQARAQLNEKRLRMRDKVLVEIRDVINAKAKAGAYTMILDVSGESANNNAVLVIYHNGENDLTVPVLTQLNSTAPPDVRDGTGTPGGSTAPSDRR